MNGSNSTSAPYSSSGILGEALKRTDLPEGFCPQDLRWRWNALRLVLPAGLFGGQGQVFEGDVPAASWDIPSITFLKINKGQCFDYHPDLSKEAQAAFLFGRPISDSIRGGVEKSGLCITSVLCVAEKRPRQAPVSLPSYLRADVPTAEWDPAHSRARVAASRLRPQLAGSSPGCSQSVQSQTTIRSTRFEGASPAPRLSRAATRQSVPAGRRYRVPFIAKSSVTELDFKAACRTVQDTHPLCPRLASPEC
jgi:hypothetical protein